MHPFANIETEPGLILELNVALSEPEAMSALIEIRGPKHREIFRYLFPGTFNLIGALLTWVGARITWRRVVFMCQARRAVQPVSHWQSVDRTAFSCSVSCKAVIQLGRQAPILELTGLISGCICCDRFGSLLG
jgi:hypothetical protein